MGRIVAISSGSLESVRPIHQYALGLISGNSRRVLFIGTASGDSEGYIQSFTEEFSGFGCEVKALRLTDHLHRVEEISALLSWADAVYVGGGDTLRMMGFWREYGLDRMLKDVYQRDSAVLMGISAGAMCWCSCGCTDSGLAQIPQGLSYGWAEGMLDMLPIIYCPHYEDRTADFDRLMAMKDLAGFAMESETALVVENGNLYCVSARPDAKAYRITNENGIIRREALPLRQV